MRKPVIPPWGSSTGSDHVTMYRPKLIISARHIASPQTHQCLHGQAGIISLLRHPAQSPNLNGAFVGMTWYRNCCMNLSSGTRGAPRRIPWHRNPSANEAERCSGNKHGSSPCCITMSCTLTGRKHPEHSDISTCHQATSNHHPIGQICWVKLQSHFNWKSFWQILLMRTQIPGLDIKACA